MENSTGFLLPDLCIARPPGRPRMCAATLLPSRQAPRQPPLASSFSALPGCPLPSPSSVTSPPILQRYFSGFLDLDKAMFRKISATTSAPRLEICLYIDWNMLLSDGHNGIRGKKTRTPECCPTTISASIAFF
ncbi:hypothetical protein TRIUR3_35453 [Triticum urartu]|uniref:Uncharacterized protein n=1 Tax=Triticum urartu TaxID=4572 RepID=M7YPT3_TRIUA|nr:hypothetical protein TRIUR3_35453 [Triticum urartu]